MVDKDFVAVDFAQRNAARNRLKNATSLLSNGFEQVPSEALFDVIASNVPAKVGKEMLSILLHDAYARLRPSGRSIL
jgi:16S rRNA (guanine1207-N2)-methyltransferase